MRHALAALALVTALPAIAHAEGRPITAGLNLGVAQSKNDGQAGLEPNSTVGLFGRVGLTRRIGAQLEVGKIAEVEGRHGEVRLVSAVMVVELGSHPRFVPTLLVGTGVAYGELYGSDAKATHIEGGFGLEYRAQAGFNVGIDLRMGGRSIDDDVEIPITAFYAPGVLQEGEYRSARLTLGIRF